MRFRAIVPLVFALFLVPSLHAAEPSGITYLTEDYPPENYVENGELKGYAVESLKAMWRKMGVPDYPIRVLPWARAYELLETNPDTMLFAMARTENREKLFKWVGPIYRAQAVLVAASKSMTSIRTLDQAKAYRIGVIRRDIAESLLIDAGFDRGKLAFSDSLQHLVQMLEAERLDMIATTENSLAELFRQKKSLQLDYRKVVAIGEYQTYFAFSKGTDDEIVERFRKAFLETERERKAIIRRYKLN